MSSQNKNITPGYAQIDLVQGRDFSEPKDYDAISQAVEATITSLPGNPENVIISGYDAGSEAVHPRKETFALTMEEFRDGAKGLGTNAIHYAGIGKPWSEKPTLGIFDSAGLTEHPGENRYTTPIDSQLEEHKLAEVRFYTPNQR